MPTTRQRRSHAGSELYMPSRQRLRAPVLPRARASLVIADRDSYGCLAEGARVGYPLGIPGV